MQPSLMHLLGLGTLVRGLCCWDVWEEWEKCFPFFWSTVSFFGLNGEVDVSLELAKTKINLGNPQHGGNSTKPKDHGEPLSLSFTTLDGLLGKSKVDESKECMV